MRAERRSFRSLKESTRASARFAVVVEPEFAPAGVLGDLVESREIRKLAVDSMLGVGGKDLLLGVR